MTLPGGKITDSTMIISGEHARAVQLNEYAEEGLLGLRQQFRDKFGREPTGSDPVFFDPDEAEPTAMSEARMREVLGDEAFEIAIEGAEAQRAIQEEHGHSRKIGRNDICPCGSGMKFKRCHGRTAD